MTRQEYTHRLLLAGLVAVVAALLVRGLPALAHLGLVLFAGILFSVVVHGFAEFLADRTPVPRKVAALGSFVGLFVLLGLTMWWSGPRIGDQFARLLERIPEVVSDLGTRIEETDWAAGLLERLTSLDFLSNGQDALGGVTQVFSTVTSAATSTLVILFVAIFLSFNPSSYRNAVLDLAPEGERRERLREVLDELGRTLRLWMKARLISMAVVGILTGAALAIAGIPLAFALALIAAVLAFVPFIGPLLAVIPAVLIGLGEGVDSALIVVAIYSGVQFLESYLIDPVLEKALISLPPAFVIIFQVFMGTLFGLMGVFLATPMAVVVVVLVQHLYLRAKLEQNPRPLGT